MSNTAHPNSDKTLHVTTTTELESDESANPSESYGMHACHSFTSVRTATPDSTIGFPLDKAPRAVTQDPDSGRTLALSNVTGTIRQSAHKEQNARESKAIESVIEAEEVGRPAANNWDDQVLEALLRRLLSDDPLPTPPRVVAGRELNALQETLKQQQSEAEYKEEVKKERNKDHDYVAELPGKFALVEHQFAPSNLRFPILRDILKGWAIGLAIVVIFMTGGYILLDKNCEWIPGEYWDCDKGLVLEHHFVWSLVKRFPEAFV